eukprot:1090744-Ditylum_brightwellii.AAC.1
MTFGCSMQPDSTKEGPQSHFVPVRVVLAIDTGSEGNKTVFHRTFLLMINREAVSPLSSLVTFGM